MATAGSNDGGTDSTFRELTQALVARAGGGDRDALAELYERHYDRVRAAVALRARDLGRGAAADVDDVIQDAFTRAFAAILAGKFDAAHSPGAFRGWIARIAANRIVDLARRRAPLDLDRDQAAASHAAGPGTVYGRRELRAGIEEALARLNPRYREVVVLRSIHELGVDEAARELGWTSKQVSYVHYRALQRLAQILERDVRAWEDFLS